MERFRHVLAVLVVAAFGAPGAIWAQQPPATPPSRISPASPTLRKSDLKIRVMLRKEKRAGKWFVRMAFRVFNVGAGPAGPSTVGAWCLSPAGGPCPALDGVYEVAPPIEVGGTAVVELATPPIPPGANVVVAGPNTREWFNGNYTIKARADFLAAVAETNEGNNNGQAAIAIP